jgi:hypothetical protein
VMFRGFNLSWWLELKSLFTHPEPPKASDFTCLLYQW